ncbi:HNH endonuclease signature motif containing protein, partial [Mycobacterium sp. E802]|uniref:HNH endonuclease signature motif containing protein n=1 Tax=Mycobacterium sp. E802 TaxID=1834152 RepID=UPI000A8A9781
PGTRAAADAAVVHLLAEQATLDANSPTPGYLPGYGIVPAQSVRDLAANATRKPVHLPDDNPTPETTRAAADSSEAAPASTARTSAPEPGYRPSVALREFIFWRDLTCRFPGCDRPAQYCDVDHTVPYPAGPTHPSNTKMYCRTHHLVKTFCPGWADRQSPDGTVEFNTPTGHTYTTEAHGATLFPILGQSTGDLNLPDPEAQSPHRGMKMPKRSHTREQERQERIAEERHLRAEINNDLDVERQYQIWLAEEYGPPPPF